MASRRWSSALVVVLIIGSMAVAGEAAHAQPVEFEARQSLWKEMTVDGQGALPPPGDSPDADQHAKLTGLSSAAAAVDLQKQILFETTATAIVESEPDSAIQFGFKNDRTPWISFKGKLSERAKSQLSRLPFSTSVRYGGSASIAELHLAQSVIADNLETVPRIKRSTGGIDPETLSIWVRYELEPGSPDLSIYESNKVLASVAALSGHGLSIMQLGASIPQAVAPTATSRG